MNSGSQKFVSCDYVVRGAPHEGNKTVMARHLFAQVNDPVLAESDLVVLSIQIAEYVLHARHHCLEVNSCKPLGRHGILTNERILCTSVAHSNHAVRCALHLAGKNTLLISNENTLLISNENTLLISNENTLLISNENTLLISNENTLLISNDAETRRRHVVNNCRLLFVIECSHEW
jgi:hypothetical protein